MSTISAKHILVDYEHEAEDLLRKLKEGDCFESLAEKFSKCPSADQGGDLGAFSKGAMVAEFDAVAFELEVDQVSEPVKTKFGHHLIQRYA